MTARPQGRVREHDNFQLTCTADANPHQVSWRYDCLQTRNNFKNPFSLGVGLQHRSRSSQAEKILQLCKLNKLKRVKIFWRNCGADLVLPDHRNVAWVLSGKPVYFRQCQLRLTSHHGGLARLSYILTYATLCALSSLTAFATILCQSSLFSVALMAVLGSLYLLSRDII